MSSAARVLTSTPVPAIWVLFNISADGINEQSVLNDINILSMSAFSYYWFHILWAFENAETNQINKWAIQ